MKLSEFTEIGKLLKPHGFKGKIELKLDYPLKDDSALASFFVETSPSPLPYFIEQIQNANGKYIVKLEDIDSLEEAKPFKNKNVYCLEVDFENYFEIEEPELYSADFLIGLNLHDQNGNLLGEVSDVFENKLNQILLQLIIEGNEVLIPFIEDQIIEIDESSESIKYNVPEGLIDIYLGK